MVVVERKQIAKVGIERGQVIPVSSDISDFIKEHKKLKAIIDRAGTSCITLEELMKKSGLSEERLQKHVDLFTEDDYVAQATKQAICNRKAIEEMSKRLGLS
ncbi:MAG: hypothetical protein ACXQTD_04265 [Candidatus Syntropharchaeia archaeon]